jgi:predicted carbohydrate-binding protein with CBM5 and CBM33 domain
MGFIPREFAGTRNLGAGLALYEGALNKSVATANLPNVRSGYRVVYKAVYRADANRFIKTSVEARMAKPNDALTWSQFGVMIVLVGGLLGAALFWLKDDLKDLRSDTNNELRSISKQLNDQVTQSAVTNQKLETLVEKIDQSNKRLDILVEQGARRIK